MFFFKIKDFWRRLCDWSHRRSGELITEGPHQAMVGGMNVAVQFSHLFGEFRLGWTNLGITSTCLVLEGEPGERRMLLGCHSLWSEEGPVYRYLEHLDEEIAWMFKPRSVGLIEDELIICKGDFHAIPMHVFDSVLKRYSKIAGYLPYDWTPRYIKGKKITMFGGVSGRVDGYIIEYHEVHPPKNTRYKRLRKRLLTVGHIESLSIPFSLDGDSGSPVCMEILGKWWLIGIVVGGTDHEKAKGMPCVTNVKIVDNMAKEMRLKLFPGTRL